MKRTQQQPDGYHVTLAPQQAPKRRAWPVRAWRWVRRHRLWLIPLAVPLGLFTAAQTAYAAGWWMWFIPSVGLVAAAVVMGASDRWDRVAEVRFARATAVGVAAWLIAGTIWGAWTSWTMLGLKARWLIWVLLGGWSVWTGAWWWHKRTRKRDKAVAEWDLQWQMIIHRMRPQPLTNSQVIDVDVSDELVDKLLIKLDRGRQSIGDLRAAGESILSAWEYPDETMFRVVKHGGGNRNWAWFHIQHANPLAEKREWDPDLAPSSFLDDLVVGFTPEGHLIRTPLRKAHWFVVGQTQWGKSSWLSLKVAQHAACDDVLIWFIDLKGGGTARPWMPVIDWLATTHDEAAEMLAAAKGVILARSAITDDHVPSPEDPAIVIIVDEANEAFGHGTGTGQLVSLGVSVSSLGAGMSVHLDVATQIGALYATGDERIRSNLSKCLAFRCQDDAHAAYAIEDWKTLAASRLNEPGMFFFKDQHKPSILGRGYWISRPQRARLANLYAGRRPVLPEALALHAGEAYLTRHERAGRPATSLSPTPQEATVSTPQQIAEQIEQDLPASVTQAQIDAVNEARRGDRLPPLTAELAMRSGQERFIADLESGPRSPKELREASGMGKTWITEMLAKLVEYGAIQQAGPREPYQVVPGMDVREAMNEIRRDRRRLEAQARELIKA